MEFIVIVIDIAIINVIIVVIIIINIIFSIAIITIIIIIVMSCHVYTNNVSMYTVCVVDENNMRGPPWKDCCVAVLHCDDMSLYLHPFIALYIH